MRRYIFIGFSEIVLLSAIIFSGGGFSELYYCGRFSDKPKLPMNLTPHWFQSNFQINRGVTSIIESSESLQANDKWVDGNQLIETIVAYSFEKNDEKIYIKSRSFFSEYKILEMYELDEGPAPYKVELSSVLVANKIDEWHKVDMKTCRMGVYFYLTIIPMILFFIFNVVIVKRLANRK